MILLWADDIIIFSRTGEEHVKHVDDILKRLDQNEFSISRDKNELGKREVKWLGYLINAEGIRPNNEKVEQLLNMTRPTTTKELRSVMGMWTYFSAFMPRYSIVAAPLTRQRKQSTRVE